MFVSVCVCLCVCVCVCVYHKVLGAYGGVTKLDTEDELIDSSADRPDCQFGLHVDQLFVDADRCP